MRIIVSGASGFVGGALVRELLNRGVDVVAVARSPMDANLPAVVVRNYCELPAGDILIHLAETREVVEVEVEGPAYVLRLVTLLKDLLNKGFSRIIYTSSAVVYGDHIIPPRRPDEQTISAGVYVRAKLACEEIVLRANGVVARLANLYGPGMASNNVISDVLAQIPGEGALEVLDESPVRDFLWIEDVARGLADMALGSSAGIFNLGSGTGVSIGGLARLALEIAGETDRHVIGMQPSGRASHLILDISTSTDVFGWSPKVSLVAGLSELLGKSDEQAHSWGVHGKPR